MKTLCSRSVMCRALWLTLLCALPVRAHAQAVDSAAARADVFEGPAALASPAPTAPRELEAASSDAADTLAQREAWLRARLSEVRDEERRLLLHDRAERPIWPGYVIMGAGFGTSAVALAIGFFTQLDYTPDDSPAEKRDEREQQRMLLGMHAVGIAVGVTGLGFVRYQLNHRPNRERTLELEVEHDALRRELKQVRRERKLEQRRERDEWSVTPQLSIPERRAGLKVALAF